MKKKLYNVVISQNQEDEFKICEIKTFTSIKKAENYLKESFKDDINCAKDDGLSIEGCYCTFNEAYNPAYQSYFHIIESEVEL